MSNSLNSTALDSEPLNSVATPTPPTVYTYNVFGIFNSMEFNTLSVDEAFAIITSNDEEVAGDVREKVGISIDDDSIIVFSEDVQFKASIAETNIIAISESVCALLQGTVVRISEFVHTASATDFLGRNGWEPILTINGFVIPQDRIYGDIIIAEEENQSNQCTFSLLVSDPVGFIDSVWGKSVTVDYLTSTSNTRMFTGVTVIPEIDLINKRINFVCSNNRDELITNNLASVVPTTGRYSEAAQGKVLNIREEMELRMKTIPYSLDFDASNQYQLNSWYAKTSPDYTFTDADIYYKNPKIIWQDRTKVKNNVSISLEYQYTRLYHYQRSFNWTFPYDFCTFLLSQYSVPNIAMIETAITNAKWRVPDPIIFTSVFPPGFCADGASITLWNTATLANKGTYSTVFDSLGNIVSDPDGRNIYGFRPFTSEIDQSTILTIGASWTAATQFSQYVIEHYNLTVVAPQSVAQFGTVADNLSSNLKDDFDASQWDAYTIETAVPSNAVLGTNGNYYYNQDTAPQNMTNAILTQLDTAKTDILSTHRNTRVVFETPIKPYLTLAHTVKVEGESIIAKGKVQKLTHTLDVTNGKGCVTEVTLALFRSQGSASETPIVAPARPSDSIVFPTGTISLGTHHGITSPSYNGYIGNKNNPRVVGTLIRTNVQEEFRVDVPGIDDTYRQARTITSTNTYNVVIPNDLLTVDFS